MRGRHGRIYVPILPLALLFWVLLSGVSCTDRIPHIQSVYPEAGDLGADISIIGEGFGDERGLNAVSIAGIEPTASSYRIWSDTLIRVQVPHFGDSGLVYVRVGKKQSNPALFTNRLSIPIPVEQDLEDELPSIAGLSPAKAPPGSLLVIKGKNFGSTRGGGAVLFTWAAEDAGRSQSRETRTQVEAQAREFAYELWSDREVRVRVPESAKSGPLIVRTQSGVESASAWFDTDSTVGTRSYRDHRTYAISYSVNYQIQRAESPNRLFLWMASPQEGNAQSNSRLLARTDEPFIETDLGYALYQFDNLSPGDRKTIRVQRTIDVWAVETGIQARAIKKSSQSPLYASFTLSGPSIPSDLEEVVLLAREITAKDRNDYAKARSIYEWMLANVFIGDENTKTGVLDDIRSKQSDPCNAALMFCTLARAADIPAIPVAGFLVARNRQSRPHWWAEFWLEDFGWVPVDPTMGAGSIPPTFVFKDNAREYYFGNMDSQRIAFSRGMVNLSQMDPRGRTSSRPKTYAFQNIWEEAVGDIHNYSTLWSELSVTGIY